MRFVRRNYRDKPDKLISANTLDHWNIIARSNGRSKIKRAIYSDPYKTADGNGSRIVDKLNKYYLFKCAYCERIVKLEVEHYRPKAAVADENNNPIHVKNTRKKTVPHPGYYWLCYEWSNLIPSCITCNREGGKYSKFPTLHHHEFVPPFQGITLDIKKCLINRDPLKAEKPYLLNPEMDNPRRFFIFRIDPDGKGIRLIGRDKDKRGDITINICKLNREEVRLSRSKIVNEFCNKIELATSLLSRGKISSLSYRDQIIILIHALHTNASNPTLDHTLLRRYIIKNKKNFKRIVLPFIEKKLQKVLLEAFTNYSRTYK